VLFSELPKTRAEALASNGSRYFTGKPCKVGHLAPRRASDAICILCSKEKHLRNREAKLDYAKRYRNENKEKVQQSMHKYYKKNRATFFSYNRLRRAQKRKAQPSWVNIKTITEIYQEAIRLTALTGTKYHVDHIIPLRGKNVCGLHVPWNLRVIPAKENLSKGNKYSEGDAE
jgi:hypothetical protein